MACYCNANVRYRGRLIEVTFRYGSFQNAEVIKGKPLPGVGSSWDYATKRPEAYRVTGKILHILRRHGIANRRGDYAGCRNCTV